MSAVRTCRVCGCTDDHACPGGCRWVEWDLCSACCELDDDDLVDSLAAELGRLCPDCGGTGSLTAVPSVGPVRAVDLTCLACGGRGVRETAGGGA